MAYVHIPFCERKCIYCDFYSIESRGGYERFLAALEKEITSRAPQLQADTPLSSIFFGGGTPSLLSGGQLARILDTLHSAFRISSGAEVTVECNPGTVSHEKLVAYRHAGVNRLSFGVQSFHDTDLALLSRIHTSDEAVSAIQTARLAGFENINLDLMFSLPGQTPERWLYNLECARELGTTHISCYSLTVEQGTPLAVMVGKGEVRMPVQESDAELFAMTMETLAGWGFRQYEISNYALPGFECRHNLGYWRLDDYVGFGPSAHGTWKDRRSWNLSNVTQYIDAVERGGTAIAGGEDLTPEMRMKEYLYLRLRSEGIDLEEYRRLFGVDFLSGREDEIEKYVQLGMLAADGRTLRLTREGMQFGDEICVSLA